MIISNIDKHTVKIDTDILVRGCKFNRLYGTDMKLGTKKKGKLDKNITIEKMTNPTTIPPNPISPPKIPIIKPNIASITGLKNINPTIINTIFNILLIVEFSGLLFIKSDSFTFLFVKTL